ncbi:MAG: hypothetical protein IJV00_06410, partial [Clostridia bacterium]|nr:hypothetical protein [Clostridia bacterium]
MYPIIYVFGKEIGTYSLFAILGVLISGFVFIRLSKKHGVLKEDVILYALFLAAGLLAGGHLLFA